MTWWSIEEPAEEVTSYKIEIESNLEECMTKDEVHCPYVEDLTHCDGSDPKVIAEKKCQIPLATLMAEPFRLYRGFPINVELIAITASGAETRIYSTSDVAMAGYSLDDTLDDLNFKPLKPNIVIHRDNVLIDWAPPFGLH